MSKKGKDRLVVLSGGMDSTTLMYDYKDEIGLAVSFSYGSKHNEREISSAKELSRECGIKHLHCPLDFVAENFKSDLLKTGNDIAQGIYSEAEMKKTVVPFRNGIMLSIAIGLAESRNMKLVMYGAHSGDHAIYPDCRPKFIEAMALTAQTGTYKRVSISSPYASMSKREIGARGHDLGVPFEKTYSCYVGGEKHCGLCPTCIERKKALKGFDYTDYEN